MIIIRYCKIVLVATVALFFSLVAFGNLTDYESNWQFVQHVLSMDTIFPDSTLKWRAITSPAIQAFAYWAIIAWETTTAVVLWVGAARLLRSVRGEGFAAARPIAVVGLSMAFVLYAVGFVAVGGEWFAMWQSETWNGESKAFEFLTLISAVLIILLIEAEPRPADRA